MSISTGDQLYARALAAFRAGRFPEAYGRFVGLAEAGHPASARYALLMCEHGLALFGKDWDCAPQEIEDWARAAGVPAPRIGPQSYPFEKTPRAFNHKTNAANAANSAIPAKPLNAPPGVIPKR